MELYLSPDDGILYVSHYNKWFKVIALFTDDDNTNRFMEENEGTAVLTQENNIVVVVMKNDKGVMTV